MSAVTLPRLHHIAITVTDLDASTAWYERVFDIHPQMEMPHEDGHAWYQRCGKKRPLRLRHSPTTVKSS